MISDRFPRYTEFDPLAPVWCATPERGGVIHRFFDTSPFSPSGRYLALTRLPYEDRLPEPGDVAEVVLVDLAAGTESVIAETRGWDTQLGAQVQWGSEDSQLYFNDVDPQEWRSFGVRLDPGSGERRVLQGPVYHVSPDGRWVVSPCLLRTGQTQPGYGVIVPSEHVPENRGAPADDGIQITDVESGESRLLASLEDIVANVQPALDPTEYRNGDFYAFHVKWNAQGDRLMLSLRWVPRRHTLLGKRKPVEKADMRKNVVTMKADGTDVHVAISDAYWSRGGHHPNWCPDGESVMMNLNLQGDGLRFVRARYDGSDLQSLSDEIPGSGHPSMHSSERYILTDAYPGEPLAFGDGTVPIRLADLVTGTDISVARIQVTPSFRGPKKEMRVDPHPAWDRSFRLVAFNGCPDGTRRVYVADLSALVGAALP